MINTKIILKIIGFLLFIEAGLLLLCSLFPIYYDEKDLVPILIAAAASTIGGIVLSLGGRNANRKQLNRRDGYIIVAISWVVFTLFGMLPYYISGYIPNITDAFFETISGFTTTGASILNNIEALPHGLLFWRSMTQWIGGLGIIFFTLAVLPIFGSGGVQLFAAEATGPKHDKVRPRIEETARWIWSIYLGLTILGIVLFRLGDMSWFDSICHSLTTTATGGYSTKQNSIAAYDSIYIEYVTTILMFLSGINFTLLFLSIFKGRIKKLFKDTEFQWYATIALVFTVIITIGLAFGQQYGSVEEAFRKALFQVVSIQTTTGFASADYMLWPPFLWFLITLLMYTGACAGSTSGAIKCIRIAMLFKVAWGEFKRILHPNAVIPVRISGHVIAPQMKITLLAFLALYVVLTLLGWAMLILFGCNFTEAYGIVVSSLGNVGPGLGTYGPAYSWNALPDAAKWISSFLMLAGRLELFSVLLLFTPAFWRKR